jgi:hypothetical protein
LDYLKVEALHARKANPPRVAFSLSSLSLGLGFLKEAKMDMDLSYDFT